MGERDEERAKLENRVIASSLENGLIVFTSTPLIVAIIRNTPKREKQNTKTIRKQTLRKESRSKNQGKGCCLFKP